jgi:hypothetical protein
MVGAVLCGQNLNDAGRGSAIIIMMIIETQANGPAEAAARVSGLSHRAPESGESDAMAVSCCQCRRPARAG